MPIRAVLIFLLLTLLSACDVPPRKKSVHLHRVKVEKLKSGKVVCHGDDGLWYFYVMSGDGGTSTPSRSRTYSTPRNSVFSPGGRWVRMSSAPDKKEIEEEEEVEIEETETGTPEGDADVASDGTVGGDGDADAGDAGGDGGGDGGE
jgi:hypothetical protein